MPRKWLAVQVVGVGGAGCRAVGRMVQRGVDMVDFATMDSDRQAFLLSDVQRHVHIGAGATRGLDGGSPIDWANGAEEDDHRLYDMLGQASLVFVVAGMGGNTGTGATPVVARVAREIGALSVAVVTTPFSFEGRRRRHTAEEGLSVLKDAADAVIAIRADKVLPSLAKNATLTDAFKALDDVMYQVVRDIADLLTSPSLIDIDFNDIGRILRCGGMTQLGIGSGKDEDRAVKAAEAAVSSHLLDQPISHLRHLLLIVRGGDDLSLTEVELAARAIEPQLQPDVDIAFGVIIDPRMAGEIKITLVGTQ